MNRQQGQSLTELIVVVALIGIFAGVTVSPVTQARQRVALIAGTSELRATFQYVRTLAIAHDRNVAIRFRQDGDGWTWAIYEDHDGDGVRNDDISRGVDRIVGKAHRFEHKPARIGVPAGRLPDPFASGFLDGRSPVRFGTSSLCSFSRAGEATNGSIVLTDGIRAVMLRVNGASARISVLRWDGRRWKEGD